MLITSVEYERLKKAEADLEFYRKQPGGYASYPVTLDAARAGIANLRAQIKELEQQKEDGVKEWNEQRRAIKHWRELYRDEHARYVKIHLDHANLKAKHDNKCLELQAAGAELAKKEAEVKTVAVAKVPVRLGMFNKDTGIYEPHTFSASQDQDSRTVTRTTERYAVVVEDRYYGSYAFRAFDVLPEGL